MEGWQLTLWLASVEKLDLNLIKVASPMETGFRLKRTMELRYDPGNGFVLLGCETVDHALQAGTPGLLQAMLATSDDSVDCSQYKTFKIAHIECS